MAIRTATTITIAFDGYWREVNAGSVPDRSGVYCVYACKFNPSSNTVALRELIYVGESARVRTRVAAHLAGDTGKAWKRRLQQGEVLCFSFGPISTERERAEAAIIFKHKPPTNTHCVNDFPYPPTTMSLTGKRWGLVSNFTVS